MALVECTDCNYHVSTSARNCMRCGNPLLYDHPGIIGKTVRFLYGLAVLLIVVATGVIAGFAIRGGEPVAALTTLVTGFVVWFTVSVSFVILLYVTRNERVSPIVGSTRIIQTQRAPTQKAAQTGSVSQGLSADAAWRLHSG